MEEILENFHIMNFLPNFKKCWSNDQGTVYKMSNHQNPLRKFDLQEPAEKIPKLSLQGEVEISFPKTLPVARKSLPHN